MREVRSLHRHECAAIYEHLILCKHTHGSKSQDAGTLSQVKVKVWFYLWMLLSNKSITTCRDGANRPPGCAVVGHVVMHSGPTHTVWHSSKSYSSKHHILYVKNKLNTVRTNRSNMTQKPQIKHGSRPDGSRKKASSKHALRARTPNKPFPWRAYSIRPVRTAINGGHAWMKTSMTATKVPVFEHVKLGISQHESYPVGRLSRNIHFLSDFLDSSSSVSFGGPARFWWV